MSNLTLNIPEYKKFSSRNVRVIVLDNGYFMFRQYALAFQQFGYQVRCFKVRRGDVIAPNYYRAFTDELILFKPDFVFTINFTGFDKHAKLAQLLAALEIPLFCYLIDHPLFAMLGQQANINHNTHLFVMDPSWQRIVKDYYGHDAAYLPAALNETVLDTSLRKKGNYQITFHGFSFLNVIEAYKFSEPLNKKIDINRLQDVLIGKQLSQPDKQIFEILADYEHKKGSILLFKSDLEKDRFLLRIMFLADLFYRESYLTPVSKFDGFDIFGDDSWSSILDRSKRVHAGRLKHTELLELYHNSVISLNLSSVQLPLSFNQKMLEIPVCGGFALTDQRAGYAELYGRIEYPSFNSQDDLLEKVEYYLTHDSERKEISSESAAIILNDHRYLNRVTKLDQYIEKTFRSS